MMSEKHTIRFVFHDFEKIPHNRDEETISSRIWCHGYQWKLCLFPGGDDQSDEDEDEVYLALGLRCVASRQHKMTAK
jgi:hypothetical protein